MFPFECLLQKLREHYKYLHLYFFSKSSTNKISNLKNYFCIIKFWFCLSLVFFFNKPSLSWKETKWNENKIEYFFYYGHWIKQNLLQFQQSTFTSFIPIKFLNRTFGNFSCDFQTSSTLIALLNMFELNLHFPFDLSKLITLYIAINIFSVGSSG